MSKQPMYEQRSKRGAHADDVLNFINEYMAKEQRAPRVKDIAWHFRASTYWASTQLRELEQRGKIRREPYAPRGIELL